MRSQEADGNRIGQLLPPFEWEAIAQFGALTVFLLIGAIGIAFLVLSFFFGEIFEMFDISGDLDAGVDDGGPGFFSLKVMSVLVTAFGGISALGVSKGLSVPVSSPIGLIGGIVLAGIVYYFGRLFYSQQSSSLISPSDLVGCKAEVIVSIPVLFRCGGACGAQYLRPLRSTGSATPKDALNRKAVETYRIIHLDLSD